MIYLNLDTGECRRNVTAKETLNNRYQIKGGKRKLNQYSNNFVNLTWIGAFFDFLLKSNYVLKVQNGKRLIGKVVKLKGIDFEDCPYILRTPIKINKTVKYVEVQIRKNTNISYTFLDGNDMLKPLDSSACKNQKITIINKPPLETLYLFKDIEKFQPFYQLVKEGKEIYNHYTNFSQDYCYPFVVLDKYDLTLKERRKFLKSKNFSICENDCEYDGDNLETLEFKCYCPLKVNTDQEILTQFKKK